MIMACAVFSSDVKVTWTPIDTTNNVAGYGIYYGPSSRNYTNSITTGYVTSLIVSNLPPNTTLFFSGVTYGYNGLQTDFGNEVQVTTLSTTNGLPSAVKDFTITKVDAIY
jgi:hypothetical protein